MDRMLASSMVLAAALLALGIFMLGRRKLNCPAGATGWRRRLWLEAAVAMAILSFVATGCSQSGPRTSASNGQATEAPVPPEIEDEDLVARLGSNDISVRETTTARLIEIGLPARTAVLEAGNSEDAEVRERARLVLTQISISLFAKSKEFAKVRKVWNELTADFKAESRPKQDMLSADFYKTLGLITEETGVSGAFAAAVEVLFATRKSHTSRSFSGRTCYEMTMDGGKQMDAAASLEEQVQLLEKMQAEGRISPEALRKIRDAMGSTFGVLYADWDSKQAINSTLTPREQAGLVDTVIQLGGVNPDGTIPNR
jgi:hypothetical protein